MKKLTMNPVRFRSKPPERLDLNNFVQARVNGGLDTCWPLYSSREALAIAKMLFGSALISPICDEKLL
jgi:hypothetical protein